LHKTKKYRRCSPSTGRDGKGGDAADVFIQTQTVIERRMGPLGTIQPFAYPALDPDVGGALLAFWVHAVAIDQMFGLAHIAAHGHGQARAAAAMAA